MDNLELALREVEGRLTSLLAQRSMIDEQVQDVRAMKLVLTNVLSAEQKKAAAAAAEESI